MEIHIFVAHLGLGGSERVCVNLATAFSQLGHRVHIIVLNLDNDINSKYLPKDVLVHELGVKRLRYSVLPILKYIRQNKVERMLVFGSEMAVFLNMLRKLHLIHTRVVVRVLNNININLEKEDNVSKVVEGYLKSAQRVLGRMDYVVAQCQAMGDQLMEFGVVSPEKLTVIYNPVSDELTARALELRNSRPVREIKEITFIGRIDPQKNVKDLVEAFALLHSRMPLVRLRLVGRGNLDNQIRELVKNKSLDLVCIFDGIRQDMENVYADSDLVVLSSKYEGMPNCLIEAIGSGIPVVSYDCPMGPSEIIVQGVNGYLVPFGDIGALSEAMEKALNTRWDQGAIVDTCSKFRVKCIAEKYEEIL